jgi:transposase InsO family protein
VLALKAGGSLKDADKIDWEMVTTLLNGHERSEQRLGAQELAQSAAMAAAAAAAAPRKSWSQHVQQQQGAATGSDSSGDKRGSWKKKQGKDSSKRDGQRSGGADRRRCFRCEKEGHIAKDCEEPLPAKQEAKKKINFKATEQVSAATRGDAAGRNYYHSLSDDSDSEDDPEEDTPAERTATAAGASERGYATTAGAAPLQQQQKASKVVQLDEALANDAWGWDSMASSCCSGNKDIFIGMKKCKAVPIQVADGNIVSATHVGSVVLRMAADSGKVVRIVMDDVLYHPRFASNLLSSELLTKKLGWEHHSTKRSCYVVTPGGNRVNLSSRGRVAVLMGVGAERACSAQLTTGAGSSMVTAADESDVVGSLVRLHERLCHMGWARMLRMLTDSKVENHGVRLSSLTAATKQAAGQRIKACVACIKGKATRTPFGGRGLDRGTTPGECLHLDTYQIKVEREGVTTVEHGLSMKDMYSGYLWHARLLTKDEVAKRVIDLVTLAETQLGCKVKRIYADGGTEFINQTLKAFCQRTGKELHWSPARTPQLNGASERSVRTFKDYSRAMMQHAGATERLWGWAAQHAAYVWNRTHVSGDTGVTPYEAMRKKKPSLRHLTAVWGCDAYCHVPREQRSALAAKAEPCIYLGHEAAQNAANVLLLSTKKIICSRDVSYRSTSFAFLKALQAGDDSVRQVVQASEADLRADLDVLQTEPAEAQGGSEAEQAALPEDAAAQEWVVDRIVNQRKKHGRMEYLVRWAGFGSDDDSWEPEAEVEDLQAMDAWRALQPAPRRSPRVNASAQAVSEPQSIHASDSHGEEEDASADEPQVHMAMCALRNLQLPEEQPAEPTQQQRLMRAVASGIAMLEAQLQTPQTYREAMAGPDKDKWRAALEKEMQSCVDQKVWTLVPRSSLPAGANVLPCKEVFKLKLNELGVVVEYKARFTPKGYRQIAGVDYYATFARTGQYKTLRVALSLAAKWDHELVQFDVPTAFLNAPVEEDIYMELPEGFEQPGMVCKLHKSLYGLKQAPRNWDRLIHSFLTSGDEKMKFITETLKFKATVSDPSLYFKRSRSGRLMLIFRFVDDLQGSHHAEDEAEFAEYTALLKKQFNIKKMSAATWMLGMRIARDRRARTITLDQELYVTKALERYGLQQCRVVNTPEAVGAAADANPMLDAKADTQRYMEMTGTLMYAAISTRPDIAHAVHYLASNMQAPTQRHMQAAERVLRYLAGTKDVGLVFGSRNSGAAAGDSRGRKTQVQVDVCAFADADWANSKGDRRSISGWVAKLNGDPVSWSSKKQRVVALSTCEAELYAESAAIQEVLWLRGLMEELGLHTQTGSVVYGDNQAAIAVSENGIKGERTKHVDVKYHFVTEAVERGVVTLKWVPTARQQADIFTKALAAPPFELLRRQIMSR